MPSPLDLCSIEARAEFQLSNPSQELVAIQFDRVHVAAGELPKSGDYMTLAYTTSRIALRLFDRLEGQSVDMGWTAAQWRQLWIKSAGDELRATRPD